MAESKNIQEAISKFSKKLRRFTQSGRTDPDFGSSQSRLLQEQIEKKAVRMRAGVVQTYRLYKAPFEALGKNSSRAASIDSDEQSLLRAYNLYKQAMDLNAAGAPSVKGAGPSDEPLGVEGMNSTFISKIEITSPLAQKASYTAGGQFVYLLSWLFFEQNCCEYIPFFLEKDSAFSLCFESARTYELKGSDKEIHEIIRQEFYS